MKKNFKFIVAAIAAIAMIGCAKDGGEKIGTPATGTETSAYFNISFPKNKVTRAVDDTATAEESKIIDAWVFLFNDAQTLESKTEMTVAGNNETAESGPIKTITGKHYVYIVVNGADVLDFDDDTKFPIPVEATSTAGMAMSAFLKTTIDAKEELPVTNNYFLMTSYAEPTFEAPTAETPSPAANKVKMGLGRAVGKVHMDGTAVVSYPVNTESVINLAYKVMNNPNKMRAFQQYNMDLLTGTIVNEVTGNGSAAPRSDYYHRLTPAVDYKAGSSTARAGIYVPENWNAISTTHNATSLVIQGQVKIDPSIKLRLANGTEGTDSHVAGATFYRVWDKQTQKWLPLFFGVEPTTATLPTLLGAAGQNPDLVTGSFSTDKYTMDGSSTTDYEFFVAKYTDANAYWRLPLKNNGKSAIARNDYFWVTIKTIAEIGASTDSEDPDDDGIIPGEPGDPPTPIDETEVDITAEITVLPWNGIDQEGNI